MYVLKVSSYAGLVSMHEYLYSTLSQLHADFNGQESGDEKSGLRRARSDAS